MPWVKKKQRDYFFYYSQEELDNLARGIAPNAKGTANATGDKAQTQQPQQFEMPKGYKWKDVRWDEQHQSFFQGEKMIVSKEAIPGILKLLYNDPRTGFVGRDKFWGKIFANFAGIPKRDVAAFLKNNETAQIFQQPKKEKIVKPIIIKNPHKYVQIDLIDMSELARNNQNYNWIYTCVDLFSKYAWAFPMKQKTPEQVTEQMKKVLEDMPEKRVTVVQSDRGSEFLGVFDEYLAEQKIKHLTSRAYTPQSQGAIESFNKTIKTMLNKFMANEDSKHYLDVLPLIVENYNTSIHTTTKQTPKSLHLLPTEPDETTDTVLIHDEEFKNIREEAQENIEAKAKERTVNNTTEPLDLNDYVRILRTRDKNYEEIPGKFNKKTIKQWSC